MTSTFIERSGSRFRLVCGELVKAMGHAAGARDSPAEVGILSVGTFAVSRGGGEDGVDCCAAAPLGQVGPTILLLVLAWAKRQPAAAEVRPGGQHPRGLDRLAKLARSLAESIEAGAIFLGDHLPDSIRALADTQCG